MNGKWLAAALVLAGCGGGGFIETALPEGLTVEYREEPTGIDTPKPRLGWRLPKGVRQQSAYEIEIDGKSCGKRVGTEQIQVAWPGGKLATSQRVSWRVRVWDDEGKVSEWSKPATFTMGVLDGWQAKWIGPNAGTRQDEDFGNGKWITAEPNEKGEVELVREFDWDGVSPAEIVHAGVSQHAIIVNGNDFNKFSGHVHDWRYLRFRNLAPWLRKGRNEMRVKVTADAGKKDGEPIDHIRVRAGKDVRAFIAKLTVGDKTILTDRSWKAAKGETRELGGIRDTVFGREMILRAETCTPYFEKDFEVKGPVKSATLHVTGVGFYEAALNGVKIGEKVLDPSPTAYDKRVLYSTYLLDGNLKPGRNTLSLLVGHGWYDMQSIATWNFETAPWRDFPRAIAQLEIVYSDGSRETVVSDGTWRQKRGPLGYDDLFEGEVSGAWDSRLPDLEGTTIYADEVAAPKGRLVAEAHPGAKVVRRFHPKAVKDCGNGTYVVDAGENVAGWITFAVRGQQAGDVISVRYDERVNADGSPAQESVLDGRGNLHFSNYRKDEDSGVELRQIDMHYRYPASHRVCARDAAFQTDRFVCSGKDGERYLPRFQYSGFGYAVVKGLRKNLRVEDVEVNVVRTAFAETGSFECSDPTFNQLMRMAENSYKANFADGVPTDCPHREKNGWTGDASIACELAQYLFENTATYEKWLRDICDSQLADGNIAPIIPTSGWGYHWGNGPAWDSALPVIAWNLWIYRGDRRILDSIYPYLVKYLDYTATRANAEGLVKHGLGDWVSVVREHMPALEFTSSLYYLQANRIAAEIAALKGLADDERRFNATAAKIRAGLNARYYKGGGVYDNGRQSAQAMSLAFGIVPESEMEAVKARLVASVEENGCHIDTGILGMKQLFRVLSKIGRSDLAWRIITNPTDPTMVKWTRSGNGSTLWEDWCSGASRNHIMFGDFAGWAYQYLAGIKMAEREGSTSAVTLAKTPGMRELVIEPVMLRELEHLSAATETPYGRVSVKWVRKNGEVEFEAVVPPGCTAELRLPGKPAKTLSCGRWVESVK